MNSKQQEAAAAVTGTPSEDSISMKTEYNPAHEVFVSEPLPAYKLKTRPTAVQIARIAAFTVIACTFIMGSFMLGAAWLQANASCSQLMHAEALLRQSEEAADRPQYQALVDPLQSDETSDSKQELSDGHQPSVRSAEGQTVDAAAVGNEQPAATPVQIKLPLELDFDEIVGALLEKNQRSRMNCVIEKKRAEEVMDHQPKTLRLPFGLNITTDPRFEHVTGERLSIVCENGPDERRAPPNPAEQMQQQQSSMMMPIPMGGNPMTHLPSMMGPPPPPPHHAQHHPQHHMHQGPPPIPLAMIARINADIDNQLQLQEQQQIEEHIIPIFQQLLPELRQAPDGGHMMREHHHHQQQQQQQQHHKQQMQMQEAEDRASAMMPGKVLYHPAMAAEGSRPLYTVAISDKPTANRVADGPPPPPMMMMHQENGPSEAARHNVAASMFHRVPIDVPVSMIMPQPGSAQSPSAPQDSPTDDSKPDHRPHFVHPRSVESVQEDVVQN